MVASWLAVQGPSPPFALITGALVVVMLLAALSISTVVRFMATAESEEKRALIAARDASERSHQALSDISHEFRTPLNSILGYTELLLEDDSLIDSAWTYFRQEQTAEETYVPFISADDPPAIEKNADIMGLFKERLEAFYYDPRRHDTYLEQLGIDYPQTD